MFGEQDGKHYYKRLNDTGGTEFTSELFDTRDDAEADARTNINGEHATDTHADSVGTHAEATPDVETPAEPAPEAEGQGGAGPEGAANTTVAADKETVA